MVDPAAMFEEGSIYLSTGAIHTVKPLEIQIPKSRLTAVCGVSGSGKTTMILESLVSGLQAQLVEKPLPDHVKTLRADGIRHVKLIDATPIGINVRSTVATYAGVHDELRKLYSKTPAAKERKLKAGALSYNTGSLRCPECNGTGEVNLDVQFLPDVDIAVPDCKGSRYGDEAYEIKLTNKAGESASLPELMAMNVDTAIEFCKDMKSVCRKLEVLKTRTGLPSAREKKRRAFPVGRRRD